MACDNVGLGTSFTPQQHPPGNVDTTDRPRLSIIVPALNEAAAILETLGALQPLRERAVEVVVAETEQGRGILGVVDGVKTKGIETEADIKVRKEFLRKIGYKL